MVAGDGGGSGADRVSRHTAAEKEHDLGGEERFYFNCRVHEVMEPMVSAFSLVQERVEQPQLHYFDSFDWRLYQNGCSLVHDGNRLALYSFGARPLSPHETVRKMPRFAWDLPAGPLRERLASLLKMRALIHRMTVIKSSRHFRLVDKHEKTVLRMILDQNELEFEDGRRPLPVSLTLKPLRGYGAHLKAVRSWVLQRGGTAEGPDRFGEVLRQAGQVPLDYQPKPNLDFQPDERADHALKQLLIRLLGTMERNESGILADLDSEFLHDFRVAVRRTRSALGQLKGVLPMEWERWARAQFALLGTATNDLRDLDVYLLEMPRYRQWVPAALEEGLKPFSRGLSRRRGGALKKLKTLLQGTEYAEFKTRWLSFLTEPDDGFPGPKGGVPIAKIAQKTIWKSYARILRTVADLAPDTLENDFHRLRIQCKKLRYLLEFFVALFPKPRVDELTASLKELQNRLGTLSDLAVQQSFLQTFAQKVKDRNAVILFLALGCLIGRFQERRGRLKLKCLKAAQSFGNRETQELFRQLCGKRSGDGS